MKIFDGNKYSFTDKKESSCNAEKFLYRQQLGNTLSDVIHNHKSDIVSKIREVANVHKYRRRLKGKCPEHESLYMSLRLCYEYDIHEKELAQNLLHELCICEGNLDTIFSLLLPDRVIKTLAAVNRYLHVLYPSFTSKAMRKKTLAAFEFYLGKIYETRERLHDGICDIVDRQFELDEIFNPLSAAVAGRDSELVQLLLRYGANPLHKLGDENPSDPLENLITGLNGIYIFNNSVLNSETMEALSEEGQKGLRCLLIFMRTINRVHFNASTHIRLSEDENDVSQKPKQKSYNLHLRLASSFDYKQYQEVRTLQHICRCAIRKNISDASTLPPPNAIQALPLPTAVRSYLDLQIN